MANGFMKCAACFGNMWPDTAQGRDHIHLDPIERRKLLKKKYRDGHNGWSRTPSPRTNSAKNKTGKFVVTPRRKVYGPF